MEKPRLIEDLGMQRHNENSKAKKHFGIFECPYCGKYFRCPIQSIKSNNTMSCGCHRIDLFIEKIKKHGLCETRLFQIWNGIKKRVRPKHKSHQYYYDKGIDICNEWEKDFMSFYNWAMGNGYSNELDIDRINGEKGYSPGNCRWVNNVVNSQNTKLLNSKNTSGYRGVSWSKDKRKWVAQIWNKCIIHHLGYFDDIIMAAKSYNDFVIKNKTYHPLNII